MRVGAIGTGRHRPNFESVDAFCDTLDFPFLETLRHELGHLKRLIRGKLDLIRAKFDLMKANYDLIRAKIGLVGLKLV